MRLKKIEMAAIETKLFSDTNFVSAFLKIERELNKPSNNSNAGQTKTKPIHK